MIRYFSVENYKNFKDVSVIEFDLHGQDKKPINTLAIYGDTFSGKSDLLEALILCIRYLADMKRNVQNPPKNITYNIPVKFHLILDIHGVEVTYQLQIAKTTDTTYSITKELYVGDVEIDTEHILEYHLSEMPIINRTFEFTQGVYVNTMIERYLPTKKSFLDNLQNFTHTARIVPSEIISQIQDFDWDFLSCKEKEFINFINNSINCIKGDFSVLFVDGICNEIHPHTVANIMALFNNERINKNNAQLIFTTTTPALMDELYPHEVYLVDKNKDNTEYVYPVSNITGLEVKRNNMCSLYKVGRLGGSPILHGRPL